MHELKSYVKVSGGKNIRLPLDHFALEKIDLRIRKLARSGLLSEHDLGYLIKRSWELRRTDIFLMRAWGDRPLPAVSNRPGYPEGSVEDVIGWVHGLDEKVREFETQYGLAVDDGEI